MDLNSVCASLRRGAEKLALQTAAQKNRALFAVAARIDSGRSALLAANALDVSRAEKGVCRARLSNGFLSTIKK